MKTLASIFTLFAALVLLPSCAQQSKCTQGVQSACSCENGLSGTQVCNAAGTYDACTCSAPRCVTGAQAACTCADGHVGTQACSADGTYDACSCPAPRCTTGAQAVCTCADGHVGTQACKADGTFDACSCPTPRCTTGAQSVCSCSDGSVGAQTCKADGTYDACQCPTSSCVEGHQASCACANGNTGVQDCKADGTYDACVCACVPRSCGEANAQCGDASDGCGNTLSCGVCATTQTCVVTPGGNTCGCPLGRVRLGDVCDVDECAEGLDTCDPHAVCTNTLGSFSCACAAGYVGDGHLCDLNECAAHMDNCDADAICTDLQPGFACACPAGFLGDGVTCEPDPATYVADMSARPVSLTIGTVGTLTARGVGRLAINIAYTWGHLPDGRAQPQATGASSSPRFTLRGLRGTPAQIEAVRALASGAVSPSMTIFLTNPAFQESVDFAISSVNVFIVDGTVTLLNGDEELAEVSVVPRVAARTLNLHKAAESSVPKPLAALMLEVGGILGDSTIWARYTSAEIAPIVPSGAGGLVLVRENREIDAIGYWTENFRQGLPDTRSLSVLELNANDAEVRRLNCYEVMPASFVVFEPTRATSGTRLLSDFVMAVGPCEVAR